MPTYLEYVSGLGGTILTPKRQEVGHRELPTWLNIYGLLKAFLYVKNDMQATEAIREVTLSRLFRSATAIQRIARGYVARRKVSPITGDEALYLMDIRALTDAVIRNLRSSLLSWVVVKGGCPYCEVAAR